MGRIDESDRAAAEGRQDLRRLPLAELRRRFAVGATRATPDALAALAEDPRAGARALAEQLRRRARRERRESRRVRALFSAERELAREGYARIAGVDEVGMGPLAGPVVAAAVVFPGPVELAGLRDSKQLAAPARERLAARIEDLAESVSVGRAAPDEIDRLNIYRAGLLAMRRAVEGLRVRPAFLLVDARRIPDVEPPQRAVVGGDARVACIAAASIVAKVRRDAEMRRLDRTYPGYGFARNAGYPTPEHLHALRTRGATPVHRRSFSPVADLSGEGSGGCRTS